MTNLPEKAAEAVKALQKNGLVVESVTLNGEVITLTLSHRVPYVNPADLVQQ